MGPNSTTPKGQALLGYHLTVNREGRITRVMPDFDYPKGDLGNPWDVTERYPIQTVADFARNLDFDALSIHTPKEQNMKLTARQNVILGLLRLHDNVPTSVIVIHTGAPKATVRRNIGALRNKGFDIERTGFGYSLGAIQPVGTVAPAVQPAQSLADDLKDEYSDASYHEDEPSSGDDDFFDGDDYDYDLEVDPFEDDLD